MFDMSQATHFSPSLVFSNYKVLPLRIIKLHSHLHQVGLQYVCGNRAKKEPLEVRSTELIGNIAKSPMMVRDTFETWHNELDWHTNYNRAK